MAAERAISGQASTTYQRKNIIKAARNQHMEEAQASYTHVPRMETFIQFQLMTGAWCSETPHSCQKQKTDGPASCPCARTVLSSRSSSSPLKRRSRSLKYLGRRTLSIGLLATGMRQVSMARRQTAEKMSTSRSTDEAATARHRPEWR